MCFMSTWRLALITLSLLSHSVTPQLHKLVKQHRVPKLSKNNHMPRFSAKEHSDVILRIVTKCSPFIHLSVFCVSGTWRGSKWVDRVSDFAGHWQRCRWACLVTVVKVWLSSQVPRLRDNRSLSQSHLVQCFINTTLWVFYYFLKLTLALGLFMNSGPNFLKHSLESGLVC